MELPVPRPAELPFAGGRAGAAVRVHPLMTAKMLAPPSFYERPAGPLGVVRGLGVLVPRSRWFALPIPAFLLEHAEAGPILIDTGLHELVATDVAAALGRLAKTIYTIEMEPSWAVPAQLRERGVDPADVALIVMTHLHYDHASGLSQFPGATVVVDEREWAAGRRGRALEGYRAELFPGAAGQDWRTLPGREDEIDLLGDGSIVLLSTPGHTPGHRSVVVRLGEGRELLLTGDAAYARRSIDEDLVPVITWRDDPYRASLARLRAWIEAHPDAPVIAGHDEDAWGVFDRTYA